MAFSHVSFNRYEYWSRLVALLEEEGGSLCKFILHTEIGIPTEGRAMYECLELNFKTNIRTSKFMYSYQKHVLLPETRCIDEKKLDIPLYTYLIEMIDKNRIYPGIENLRICRNQLMHMKKDLSAQEFHLWWDEIWQILVSLKSKGYEWSHHIPRKGNVGQFHIKSSIFFELDTLTSQNLFIFAPFVGIREI